MYELHPGDSAPVSGLDGEQLAEREREHQDEQDRPLWQPPTSPPRRPDGAPMTYGPSTRLSRYRSSHQQSEHELGRALRGVWAWVERGNGRARWHEWVEASVYAEGRDEQGWWWVWLTHSGSTLAWVLTVRTARWEPSPEHHEWAARIRALGDKDDGDQFTG